MALYLGLTGNIAGGKSTVAEMFEKLGCYTIDADELSREVMAKGGGAYDAVVSEFGAQILDNSGEIDRKGLKAIVFADDAKRKTLEQIVHPAIFDAEKKKIGQIKGRDNDAIILTQAALSVETGSYKRFQALIVVYTDEQTQLERLLHRDGIDEATAKRIMQSQMPIDEKVKYADYVVDNSGKIDDTRKDVERVFEKLKLLNYASKQLKKEGQDVFE